MPNPPVSQEAYAPATGEDVYARLQAFWTIGDPATGYRRIGTPGDAELRDWLTAQLLAAGLDEVYHQAFDYQRFIPHAASLRAGELAPAVSPRYYSGDTGPGGLTAELVPVGSGSDLEIQGADLNGKIALIETPVVINFTAPLLERSLALVAQAGAAGAVVAPQAFQNWIMQQNAEERSGLCDLPTLYVGKQDGQALRAQAGRQATLLLDAEVRPAQSANVVGILHGRSSDPDEDIVVIGTPTTGWFHTATERGPGIGALISFARLYAQNRPQKTIIFFGYAGHEVGAIGMQHMVQQLVDDGLLPRISAYVHLGASLAARDYVELAGQVIESGLVEENRSLTVSENPVLEAISASFLGALPIATLPPAVLNPGGQRYPYAAGIPMIGVSGAHVHYHTPGDLPHTTSAALLNPIIQAFRQTIDSLLVTDGALIRAANGLAAALASPVELDPCPGQ